MRKLILLFMVIMFAFPCLVLAEIDTDVRLKLGNVAGADRVVFANAVGHGSNNNGTNAQLEVVLAPHRDSRAGFIMTFGIFHRQHEGQTNDLLLPIKVGYAVTGMSIAPGLRIRISDAWTFEGKLELGGGTAGHVTLNTPGVVWNATKSDDYQSASLIAGWYYLFKGSGNKVGLELGAQEFEGDFEIWSNTGMWTNGHVTGTNGTVNVVYGMQF
jgi:hypothetical protein